MSDHDDNDGMKNWDGEDDRLLMLMLIKLEHFMHGGKIKTLNVIFRISKVNSATAATAAAAAADDDGLMMTTMMMMVVGGWSWWYCVAAHNTLPEWGVVLIVLTSLLVLCGIVVTAYCLCRKR